MRSLFACLAVLLLADGAQAKVTAVGPAKDVDPCPNCVERRAAVSSGPTGVLVAFESGSTDDPHSVWARAFTPAMVAKGAAFLVNLPTLNSSELQPSVAATTDGFLVAYEVRAPNGNTDIVVRKFGPTGVPIGAATAVNIENLLAPTDDRLPHLAVKPDGGFAVTWNSIALAGGVNPPGPPRVLTRFFTSALAPVGNPTPLNTSLLGTASAPSTCWDTSGRLVVAFKTIDEIRPFEPSLEGVSIRRVTAQNKPAGAELKIALPDMRSTSFALACIANAGFRVIWESERPPAGPDGALVYANYSKVAKRVGAIAKLNSTPDGHTRPNLAVDSKGNWVAVWESDAGLNDTIRGRRILANGVVDGNDFLIAQKPRVTSPLRTPVVAFTGAAGFVVLWEEDSKNTLFRNYKTQ